MAHRSRRQESRVSSRELESRLVERVQRYELLFKATNDVVYELDLVKGTVTWNDAFYSNYGYDRDENANTFEWWTQHVHPDDALRVVSEISNWYLGSQETWHAEYRFQKASGSYVYVRDRGIVQRTPDGTPLRIIGALLDITREKQLDRAKDEFISLISHQLRTPLTTIRLYSEMLSGGYFGTLTNEQKKKTENISSASYFLIQLVGDILDTSRIELGHIIVNPIQTDIVRFLSSYVDSQLPIAAENDVSLRLSIKEKIPMLPIDAIILGRILQNLTDNAIRYAKQGKGVVTISFRKVDDEYELRVRDNGIGIPRDDRPYVFKRFYRGENAINISERGSGLGLYIVKHLAEAAGCTVSVTSAKGKGTTFTLHIPANGMNANG